MKDKSVEAKLHKKSCSKEYKKAIRSVIFTHKKDLNCKLRSLKGIDCRKYWDILRRPNGNANNECQGSCENFANHFTELNKCSFVEPEFVQKCEVKNFNVQLNALITEAEVMKGIAALKSNKACGFDGIINEFIKCSKPKMCNCICSYLI